MKPLKLGLRFWILISSVFSFLVGWGMFSHAGKPTPFSIFTSTSMDLTSTGASNSLPPIPSLDSLLTQTDTTGGTALTTSQYSVQQVQIPSTNTNSTPLFSTPRLHTKGS